eukprot:423026_1
MIQAKANLLKTPQPNYGQDNNNYCVSNVIFEKCEPQPKGQRFSLNAQSKTPNDECVDAGCDGCSDPRGIIVYPIMLIGIPIGAIALFASGYIGWGFLCLALWILIIVLMLYCFGGCKSKGEKWLKYVLIVDIDVNKLYVVEESTLKRWKLTKIILLNQMRSISANWQTITRGLSQTENAYVIIQLSQNRQTKMNQKSATIIDVKHFIATVNKYFEQIGNRYRNAVVAMNNIDESLRKLIRSLKLSSDNEIKTKGMKLDYWYEMKKESIVNEFIDLLKQTRQYENQWTHVQRSQYIVDALMLKCETLENIRNNENNNAYESNTDVRCNLVQVEKLCM